MKTLILLLSLVLAGCATGPTSPAQRAAAWNAIIGGALRQPPNYSTYNYRIPERRFLRTPIQCITTSFGGVRRTQCY